MMIIKIIKKNAKIKIFKIKTIMNKNVNYKVLNNKTTMKIIHLFLLQMIILKKM